MKEIGVAIVVVAGILGLTWVAQGNDFFLYRVFAPRYEQVRRETFEQSKAYNQGTIQNLQKQMFEYQQADDSHRAALGSIILHEAADYPDDRLTPELRDFLDQLRRDQMTPHR